MQAYRFLFCFILLALAANAAVIRTKAICDSNMTPGTTQQIAVDPILPQTLSLHRISSSELGLTQTGHLSCAAATFQDDFVFTVTGGLVQGFFSPCFEVGAECFQGGASSSASFGNNGISNGGNQGGFNACGPSLTAFTLGVPQTFTLSLSASANAGIKFANRAQAGANALLDSFEFFNDSGRAVSGVTYALVEVPEPPFMYVFCGRVLAILPAALLPSNIVPSAS
jgi:hypothetical protein